MQHNNEILDDLNAQLYTAAEAGDAALVQSLLNGGADPTASNSIALSAAAERGHTAVVRVLLDDRRADPAANDSRALAEAVRAEHTDVVRALLKDGRADPAADRSAALSYASACGNTDIVHALLRDGRADPAAYDNRSLSWTVQRGHLDTARALLGDARVTPNAGTVREAAVGGDVDMLQLLVAAMGAKAAPVIDELLQCYTVHQPVAVFLKACKADRVIAGLLYVMQALLKTDLPTQSVFSLAFEGVRLDMSPVMVKELLLQHMSGPHGFIPHARLIEQQRDLFALANVSKAEPMLQAGSTQLDPAQLPGLLAALAPTLPSHVVNAMWQTIRAQARGDEPARGSKSRADHTRDRMAANVFLTAVVKEYNALVADTKKVTEHKQPLLSAAANRFLRALNALGSAIERKDVASITAAQAQLGSIIDTYEERISSMLADGEHAKRAQRFEMIRSIIDMPPEQVAELAQAQARQRTARKALAIEI